jgi:hypothetical protein
MTPARPSVRFRENTNVKRIAWKRAILLALCALPLWAAGAPAPARAQLALTVVQAEGSYNQPVKSAYIAGSGGFGLSLGTRFVVPGGWQTFDLGFQYAGFGPSASNVLDSGVHAYRGIIGTRLSLDTIVRPGLFAHLGFARVTGEDRVLTSPLLELLTRTAFTWDAGAFLDLALAGFELGVHFAYEQIASGRAPRPLQWLAIGGHLALVF